MIKYKNMLDIDSLPTIGRLQIDVISIAEMLEYRLMGRLINNPNGYYYKDLLNPIMVMNGEYTAYREWLVDVTSEKKELGVHSVYDNVFENVIYFINQGYEIYDKNGKKVFNNSQLVAIKKNNEIISRECRLPYIGLQIVKLYVEYLINLELAYVGRGQANFKFKSKLLDYMYFEHVSENNDDEFIDTVEMILENDLGMQYVSGCINDLMEANNHSIMGDLFGWNWNLFTVNLYNSYLIINKGVDYRIYEWSVNQIRKGEEDESNS